MDSGEKVYNLEERTALFAERVKIFAGRLPKNPENQIFLPQLIRASSSPGANYIEANESIGDKDFVMKIKTCRREAKEAGYWLRLVTTNSSDLDAECSALRQEARELMLIFNAIVKKREGK